MSVEWHKAIENLVELAPKLAFKSELLEALKAHTKVGTPTAMLGDQLEAMLAVTKQNVRVAQLLGYPSLEAFAKQVEEAIVLVITTAKLPARPAKAAIAL